MHNRSETTKLFPILSTLCVDWPIHKYARHVSFYLFIFQVPFASLASKPPGNLSNLCEIAKVSKWNDRYVFVKDLLLQIDRGKSFLAIINRVSRVLLSLPRCSSISIAKWIEIRKQPMFGRKFRPETQTPHYRFVKASFPAEEETNWNRFSRGDSELM